MARCPHGHPVEPDARFCRTCGAAVVHEATAVPAPAASSGRRRTTVVFAAILGALVLAGGAIAVLQSQSDEPERDSSAPESKQPRTGSTRQERSTTTSAAPTTALGDGPTRTTVPCNDGPSLCSHWTLNGNRVGAAALGEPFDETIDALRAVLGKEDSDEPVELCPSGQIDRTVVWGDFQADFGRGEDGVERFVGWGYGARGRAPAPLLTTEERVTVGDTVASFRTAYREAFMVFDDDGSPYGPSFEIRTADGTMNGATTGVSDSDVITAIAAGAFCGE